MGRVQAEIPLPELANALREHNLLKVLSYGRAPERPDVFDPSPRQHPSHIPSPEVLVVPREVGRIIPHELPIDLHDSLVIGFPVRSRLLCLS